MSRLKEMKIVQEKKGISGLVYTALGALIILGALAMVYFALFGKNPNDGSKPFDVSALESGGHTKENPAGKISVVEFSDFQCPACGHSYPIVKRVLSERPEIRFTYRHFPLSNIHPFAQKAAEASECASEQGKFWEMHDTMFENQQNLTIADLKSYAARLSLDGQEFSACLDSGKYAPKVASDFSYGVSIGINSTPTFFINGAKYSGLTYEEFSSIIASQPKA